MRKNGGKKKFKNQIFIYSFFIIVLIILTITFFTPVSYTHLQGVANIQAPQIIQTENPLHRAVIERIEAVDRCV